MTAGNKLFIGSLMLFLLLPSALAQINPVEIKNPRLKAAEQEYLPQLLALNQAVSRMKFPFQFSLNRYVGLDPKDQAGADKRGLEFVNFHDRVVLKFTGNYNAAFNSDMLSPNQRAGRVFNEVIVPILRLLPEHFSDQADFDAFGFEIGYHVSLHTSSYGYEGKEFLVVVLDKSDGLRYAALSDDASRQEVLNRSEIYLNGKPFGLALHMETPFDTEALVRRPAAKKAPPGEDSTRPAPVQNEKTTTLPKTGATAPDKDISARTVTSPPPGAPPAAKLDVDALQAKYQSQLEALKKEGIAKYNFADYAPPAFVTFRNQRVLQVTLRSPETFDRDSTSIYKRAARTFDLFLAPQLKGILAKVPENPDFSTVDFTVVLELTAAGSAKHSEAIEFIMPLQPARRFADADITNQDLINESVVLVNGVRIALNLAQVE